MNTIDFKDLLIKDVVDAIAEKRSATHSSRVAKGMAENVKQCLYNGHKILGYKAEKKSPYYIDEETAPIIRKIFEDYISGKGPRLIANELNDAGYRTLAGNNFTEKTLWHTLHNDFYTGVYRFGDVVVPGGVPAIIDKKTFNKAQALMEQKKHGNRGRKSVDLTSSYWLLDYLYCGACNRVMDAENDYYRCPLKKKCASILKTDAEQLVQGFLSKYLSSETINMIADAVYKKYVNDNEPAMNQIVILERDNHFIDIKLKNYLDAIEAGVFNELTQTRMKELQNQKRENEKEIANIKASQKVVLTEKDFCDYLKTFVKCKNSEQCRQLLSYVVEKIDVTDEQLVIHLNYSNECMSIERR